MLRLALALALTVTLALTVAMTRALTAAVARARLFRVGTGESVACHLVLHVAPPFGGSYDWDSCKCVAVGYGDGAGWSGNPSKNAGQGPSLRAVRDVIVPSLPSIVNTPQLNVAPRPNCGTIWPETATIQTGASSSAAAAGLYAPGSPLARYSRHVISLASIRSIRRTSAV